MNVPRETTGFRDKKKEGMKGDCIYEHWAGGLVLSVVMTM
jgi:hypothetical protein